MNFLNKIVNYFSRLFRKPKSVHIKNKHYNVIPKEITGAHDCALRALHITCPDISIERMKDGFNLCCENWPYAGVTNKEFNISISYLKIKDRFKYYDNDNTPLKHLLTKDEVFIALLYGHYTVVYEGKTIDSTYPYADCKVYCYWQLL